MSPEAASKALTLWADPSKYGPKMKALPEARRQFVLAMLATGGKNKAEAARMAGYKSPYVEGCRLASDPQIRAAMQEQAVQYELMVEGFGHDPETLEAMAEEAANRIRSGAILGASALWEIAMDPLHKDRLKAAQDLLDRGQILQVQHNQTIKVEHVTRTTQEKVERIIEIAKKQGLDPHKLLGDYGVVIDAEFKVIDVAAETGIEDLLA